MGDTTKVGVDRKSIDFQLKLYLMKVGIGRDSKNIG